MCKIKNLFIIITFFGILKVLEIVLNLYEE